MTEELATWQEDGEYWRALKVRFPDYIATHTRDQTSYFGPDGLLRRHQYTVDVLGNAPGLNYASHYRNVSGGGFSDLRHHKPSLKRTPLWKLSKSVQIKSYGDPLEVLEPWRRQETKDFGQHKGELLPAGSLKMLCEVIRGGLLG